MTVTKQPKNMIDFNNAAGRKGQRSMLQPQKGCRNIYQHGVQVARVTRLACFLLFFH